MVEKKQYQTDARTRYHITYPTENKCVQSEKTVIILQGAPGSGKSDLAKTLAYHAIERDFSCTVISTDNLFYVKEGNGRRYVFDPEKLVEYHNIAYQNYCEELDKGTDLVILDNVNAKRIHAQRYVLKAQEKGRRIKIIRVDGTFKNEHNVSDDKVEQIRRNMEDLSPLLRTRATK